MFILLYLLLFFTTFASANTVAYLPGSANTQLFQSHVLSDGTVLVGGQTDNLNWVPQGSTVIALSANNINSQAVVSIAFIAHFSGDLQQLKTLVHFPLGTVRNVFRIRSSEIPGQPTGDIFISGMRDLASWQNTGYYIAKLNGNFVNQLPSGLVWSVDINAEPRQAGGRSGESAYKTLQPWDVAADGSVLYGRGAEYDYGWAAVEKLHPDGSRAVVENWPAHWLTVGGECHQKPASACASAVKESAIILKTGRKGSLRSWTQADYEAVVDDGNGGTRQGKFPDDYFFSGPCNDISCAGKGGYTGYKPSDKPTARLGGIVIDKTTGWHYIGYSTQSVLPGGNPDFEPVVVAFDATGALQWVNRLYKENNSNSSPDQYVDALAIDYANRQLVVLARTHGNNTVNLWSGNAIAANPAATGFQNRFTGTSGNIHISWLGKFALATGVLQASTYVAEYANTTGSLGQNLTDPNLDHWPNPNAGWPNLNTTRCANGISIGKQGEVAISCTGRRVITTKNAHQAMYTFAEGESKWSDFIRVYSADLSKVIYSTLLTNTWDSASTNATDLVDVAGINVMGQEVIITGTYNANDPNTDTDLPVKNVPSFASAYAGQQSGVFARLATVTSGQQRYDHGNPSDLEQLSLELVNRGRLDPQGEADRYLSGNLNEGLSPGTLSTAPKQPLAFNPAMIEAAREHTQWQLDTDTFSHTGEGGSNAGQRIQDAGYAYSGARGWGENIAWSGTTGTPNLPTYTENLYKNLFVDSGVSGRGHRINLLNNSYREIGIGVVAGAFTTNGKTYNSVMTTQDFAYSGGSPAQAPGRAFLLGVVYEDINGNQFYDPGEGLGGIEVRPSAGDFYAVTSSSGGYALPLQNTSGNSLTVSFSGANLDNLITKTVNLNGDLNVKLDLIKGESNLPADSDNDGIPDAQDSAPNDASNTGAVVSLATDGTAASGQYGYLWVNNDYYTVAAFTFNVDTSQGVDYLLSFNAYDVDYADEIGIYLNGAFLANANLTANDRLSNLQTVLLRNSQLIDGENRLTFQQDRQAGYIWGVSNVAITEATVNDRDDDGIPDDQDSAPDDANNTGAVVSLTTDGKATTGQYGYRWGSVNDYYTVATFEFAADGMNDYVLAFRGYDIDYNDEVALYVDDIFQGFLAMTPNEDLGDRQAFLLTGLSAGTHRIAFEQDRQPGYIWGVQDVALWPLGTAGVPQIATPLPTTASFSDNGRQLMAAGLTLDGSLIDNTIPYTLTFSGFDIDSTDEIAVFVNGVLVGYAAETADNASGPSTLTIPAGLLQMTDYLGNAMSNKFVFLQRTPKYIWGVSNIQVSP